MSPIFISGVLEFQLLVSCLSDFTTNFDQIFGFVRTYLKPNLVPVYSDETISAICRINGERAHCFNFELLAKQTSEGSNVFYIDSFYLAIVAFRSDVD